MRMVRGQSRSTNSSTSLAPIWTIIQICKRKTACCRMKSGQNGSWKRRNFQRWKLCSMLSSNRFNTSTDWRLSRRLACLTSKTRAYARAQSSTESCTRCLTTWSQKRRRLTCSWDWCHRITRARSIISTCANSLISDSCVPLSTCKRSLLSWTPHKLIQILITTPCSRTGTNLPSRLSLNVHLSRSPRSTIFFARLRSCRLISGKSLWQLTH